MGWYNSNWQYRKKITIDNTKVNADLTDFPVYVDLSDLGSDFFSNVKTDGGDIRITKADGTTEVPREVVAIDTGSSSGELHFKADALGSTTDTEFYIYYGNAAASDYAVTDTYGRNNVWTNNFEAVYHLNQEPTTATAIIDSTGVNDSTAINGSMTSADLVDVKLGKGIEFDGVNDSIVLPNINITTAITCQAWVQAGSTSGAGIWLSHDDQGSERKWYMQFDRSNDNFHVNIFNESNTNKNYRLENVGVTALHLYHFGFENNVLDLYQDGVKGSPTIIINNTVNTLNSVTEEVRIGNNAASNWSNSKVDEVRIASVKREDGWISTEYNNQNSASTFYTSGAQETGQINIVSISPAHESTGNAVDTNLVITYDQNATAGTGSLTVTQRDGLIIGDGFAGKIGEMILTNENLSQDTIQKVEGYLAWKWFGINNPLPDSHPYKLRRPVI